MTELSYRPATHADLAFMIPLVAMDDVAATAADWAPAGDQRYAQALDAIAADPNQTLYVAELGGAAVGVFQLTFIPGIMRQGLWRGLIESVHVSPHHRNRGYGKTMIRWAIERCREKGCSVVQLTSSKKRVDAHRFYRTLGFDQSHEGFKMNL